jgi:hypothetical protein
MAKASKRPKFDCVSTSSRTLFSAFYLLAFVGKLLGVFPLQNVMKIGKRCSGGGFRYLSWIYLYSCLFLPINVVFLGYAQFYWRPSQSDRKGPGGEVCPKIANNDSSCDHYLEFETGETEALKVSSSQGVEVNLRFLANHLQLVLQCTFWKVAMKYKSVVRSQFKIKMYNHPIEVRQYRGVKN